MPTPLPPPTPLPLPCEHPPPYHPKTENALLTRAFSESFNSTGEHRSVLATNPKVHAAILTHHPKHATGFGTGQ